ncbi:preprotein translocase subunit SecD [Streptomyces fildesensis]|uniref:Preprotein translocase subunit SecD n=1 Tax=Streptomyces fildesensis TaxID=375757 RepID=A0ABW8C9D0_9ACTN
MRLLRTTPRATSSATATALTAVAAVLVMSAALTGCSGSSNSSDGKVKSPLLSGPSGTAASTASATPAKGRTTVTYTPRSAPGDETLRHTVDLLRARADAFGLDGARIEVHGGTITAEAPGDSGDRLRQLAVTAELGFRPVLGGDASVPPELQRQFTAFDCMAPVPASAPALSPTSPTVACDRTGPTKYVLGPVALSGRDVTSAKASLDAQTGNGWTINLVLTSAGGAKFAELTGRLSQQSAPANQIGIMLDRQVISAPSVSQSITGGQVQISGNFTRTSAQDLAAQISSGALPVELTVSDVTHIPS